MFAQFFLLKANGLKETQQYNLLSNFSGETITFTMVQMHVNGCCIAHLLQPGVKTVVIKQMGV